MRVIVLSVITSFFCYSAISNQVETKQEVKEKEKDRKEKNKKIKLI